MVMVNESVRTRITWTAEQQLCPHCAKYYWQKMCESIGRVPSPTDNMIPKRPAFNPIEMIFLKLKAFPKKANSTQGIHPRTGGRSVGAKTGR